MSKNEDHRKTNKTQQTTTRNFLLYEILLTSGNGLGAEVKSETAFSNETAAAAATAPEALGGLRPPRTPVWRPQAQISIGLDSSLIQV